MTTICRVPEKEPTEKDPTKKDSTQDVWSLDTRSMFRIGPYGAAHLMVLLGRHSRLVFDSRTRPRYAQVNGRKASDATVERRFRVTGGTAALAFWLYLTKDWVPG
jgi:hypothetical protein